MTVTDRIDRFALDPVGSDIPGVLRQVAVVHRAGGGPTGPPLRSRPRGA